MGLDYLNKKLWHPGSLQNIQKVWELEKQQHEVNRRNRERQKKLMEERHNEELKRIQVEAGLIPRSHLDRMEWMYDWGNKLQQQKSTEEYLTGQTAKKPEAYLYQEETTNAKCEDFSFLYEDPLVEIRRQQLAKRQALLNNPIHMKAILQEAHLDYTSANDSRSRASVSQPSPSASADSNPDRVPKRNTHTAKGSNRSNMGGHEKDVQAEDQQGVLSGEKQTLTPGSTKLKTKLRRQYSRSQSGQSSQEHRSKRRSRHLKKHRNKLRERSRSPRGTSSSSSSRGRQSTKHQQRHRHGSKREKDSERQGVVSNQCLEGEGAAVAGTSKENKLQSEAYRSYLKERFGGVLKEEAGHLRPDYGRFRRQYQTQSRMEQSEAQAKVNELRMNAVRLRMMKHQCQGGEQADRRGRQEVGGGLPPGDKHTYEEGTMKLRRSLMESMAVSRHHPRESEED